MGKKDNKSLFLKDCNGNFHEIIKSNCLPYICVGHTRSLTKYGIYITNNGLKMHGHPMIRRVAGRKGVRKKEH